MKEKEKNEALFEKLREDFYNLRTPEQALTLISEIKAKTKEEGLESDILLSISSQDNNRSYPNQGLMKTGYDNVNYGKTAVLDKQEVVKTLALRRYFLTMFNHPYRLLHLAEANQATFVAPPKVEGKTIDQAVKSGIALAIGDLSATIVGAKTSRTSRTERYAQGPFVKLGRQARTIFVGSDSPDVWNSSLAIATMAASHCLASVPRNGVLVDITRQAKVAEQAFALLSELAEILPDEIRSKTLNLWQRNICGVLEASEKAIKRAEVLFNTGVRSFRVYSPEPGTGPIEVTKALRKEFGEAIEIFSGQVVSVTQAKELEEAGAEGIFVGIGGGGRCTTGLRSGSAVDWPELVWRLRGEVDIPIIVEGGASDHIPQTLLLGATGISVSRIGAGGTIESPGGVLYFADSRGRLFKPYGGEASARTKSIEGKMLPFGIPSFVEGETTKAYKSYLKHALATLTYNLHQLTEDAILALVFRNAKTIEELQTINPSPLRRTTALGEIQKNTH